jgi:hypothetical protein
MRKWKKKLFHCISGTTNMKALLDSSTSMALRKSRSMAGTGLPTHSSSGEKSKKYINPDLYPFLLINLAVPGRMRNSTLTTTFLMKKLQNPMEIMPIGKKLSPQL